MQEALTNVAKHAEAKSVRVALGTTDGQLQIEVQDDGCGFDPETAGQGFGLEGMRERVSLAGDTLTVGPSEHGTLARACMPTAVTAGEQTRLAAS